MLRKINAVISLIITVLLLDHAIFNAIWMLSMGSIQKNSFVSRVLLGLMLVHAIMSIVLAVLGHKGAEKRKCNEYKKLNRATNIQRIGGILLIIFTILHVLGTIGITQTPRAVHMVLPPLFFAVALMHVAVSGSKPFISLGIGSAKFIKIADIVIKIICALTLVACVIGFYLFLV